VGEGMESESEMVRQNQLKQKKCVFVIDSGAKRRV